MKKAARKTAKKAAQRPAKKPAKKAAKRAAAAAPPPPPPPVEPDPPAPPAAPSRWIAETQKDVAEFFGVSFDTVKTWMRNGAPRPATAKQYDLAAIARWVVNRRSVSTAVDTGTRTQQLTVRKLEAEVLAKERANLQAAGVLVDRRAIESQIGQLLIEARKMFERLPTRIQPAIPRELEATLITELRRLVHSTLHELADRMQQFTPPEEAA